MAAYYNEHDPFAARWLRNLIAAGQLPAGIVDERDIQLVKADDLNGFTQCHFFAGIGGWPLALRMAGWDDDCPVWTGSCPCQPFSVAGKRKGKADERHLWPVFRQLIAECSPAICFGEQVASKDGVDWIAEVFHDLEAIGRAFGGAIFRLHASGRRIKGNASTGLPTPRASMGKHMICWSRAKSGDHRFQLEDFLASIYLADGGVVISGLQPSPLLCLTLMGYPDCWLELGMRSSRS